MRVEPIVNPNASLWDWLAYDLRFYRKKYGLTQNAMASIIATSPNNLSNLEAGRRRLTDDQAKRLDEHFKTGGHFQRLLSFARRGHDPNWFQQYKGFELAALIVKTFEGLTVPGLLQTPEYARALVEAVGEHADVEGVVKRRMARQEIFERDEPPILWAIVTESVIDWPIGDDEVMREQLAHLLDISKRPNIALRVVERSARAHAGVDGSFSIISGDFGQVAYTESPGAGRLVPSATEIRSYEVRYGRIGNAASPENRSREVIQRAMEALK